MGFWSRLSLHRQLILVSSLLLLVTLLVTTLWNVQAQRRQLIDEAVAKATSLAQSAALASREKLVREHFDDLEALLLQLALFPDLIELAVLDPAGRLLADVRQTDQGPRPDYRNLQRELPAGGTGGPGESTVVISGNELAVWQPVRTSTPLGWVYLRIDLTRVQQQVDRVMRDNLMVAGGATLLDLLVLLWVLWWPGRSFREAVGFAQQLTRRPGEHLVIKPGSREVGELIHALNRASDDLARQHAELESMNQQLEQRVQERTRALEQSQRRLKRLHHAVTQSQMALVMLDDSLRIEEANHAFESMTGHDGKAVIGQDLFELIWSSKNPPQLLDDLRTRLLQGEGWQGEITARRANGFRFWVKLAITVIQPDEAGPEAGGGYLMSMEDISERKEYEKQLIQQANFDALTGLPNRVLGFDRLQQAIRVGKRQGKKTVVMYLDLDRFKQVNDTLGHRIGDLMLIEVAGRLTRCLRPYDVVARLSGDEFLIVLSGVDDPVTVEGVAEKILHVLGQPFRLEGRDLHVGASIGISVIPDDGENADEILRYADTAMYQAKQAGRNCFKYYTQSMNEEAQRRLKLDSAMHEALGQEEIELCLQPIVDCPGGRTVGAEALMRWNSVELGEIPPEQFIPIAEENGLIDELGAWMLAQACKELARLPGLEFITVNVASSQFRDAAFADRVADLLRRHELAPDRLHLEITERVLMADQKIILDNIRRFGELGIGLVIDDFGTGYSSLSYLSRFPCHALKIDRSFIRAMNDDPSSEALVDAIINMSHALGLRIIAEGVETRQQWETICAKQTDLVQGFLFSKPLTMEEFRDFLERQDDPVAQSR
jgi:diguanylate cyclase (GGDEF)-like protein/PAS domain S-box-containing protein